MGETAFTLLFHGNYGLAMMEIKKVFRPFKGRPWVNALIALLQVLVIVAAGRQYFENLEKAALEEFNQRQLILAGEATGKLKLYLEFLSGALGSLGRMPGVHDFDEKLTRQIISLEIHELARFGVKNIEVMDEKGILRYGVMTREMEGKDFSWRKAFREAKKRGTADSYIMEFSSLDPEQKEILIAVPMFKHHEDKKNPQLHDQFAGVVLCSLTLENLTDKFIAPIKPSARGHAFLLDERQDILWTPDRSLLGKNLGRLAEGFPSFQQLLQEMKKGSSGTGGYSYFKLDGDTYKYTRKREEKLLAHVPIQLGGEQWTLGVWAPKRDAISLMRSTHVKQIVLVVIVIMIILLGPAYSLTTSLRYSMNLEKEVKAKTREFKDSHERLLTVLDSLDASVYVANIDTHEILFVNKYTRDRYGDVVGKTCWTVFQHGEDPTRPCESCPDRKMLIPDKGPTGVRIWEFQDNVTGQWYEIRDRAITWVDGRIVRLEIATDVTDRKLAEEELKRSAEQLSSLLESLPVIVPYTSMASDGMGITYVSNTIEELTGYDPAQFTQDSKFWSEHIHPNDRERVFEELSALFEEGSLSLEYSFQTADGSYKLFNDTRSLVKLPDGTGSHIAGTWQDITEKKSLRKKSLSRMRSQELGGFGNIIGASHPMQEIYERIHKIIEMDVKTVLILGETGTGKDLAAKTIHEQSPRSDHPFTDINCASIPDNLLESELFGHEKGAFTDAKGLKRGLLEQAPMGTILLNEIGHMKLDLQAKLLRVIEERKFRRVGGVKDLDLDVRLLVATNKGLWRAVEKGEFREDLYYRIKLVPIYMPPLRDRKEDIPLLIKRFIELANRGFDKNVQGISKDAMERMIRYDWPGNVRELKNVIERAIILGDGDQIQEKHLPREIISGNGKGKLGVLFELPEQGISLAGVEKTFFEQALKRTEGNQIQTAKLLGLTRHAVRHRMKKYGFL